jgi:hypothetical protein
MRTRPTFSGKEFGVAAVVACVAALAGSGLIGSAVAESPGRWQVTFLMGAVFVGIYVFVAAKRAGLPVLRLLRGPSSLATVLILLVTLPVLAIASAGTWTVVRGATFLFVTLIGWWMIDTVRGAQQGRAHS